MRVWKLFIIRLFLLLGNSPNQEPVGPALCNQQVCIIDLTLNELYEFTTWEY